MAASSILKEFYVYDQKAFARLKKELDEPTDLRKKVIETPSEKMGKKN